jgi:hypothetical protein
MLSFVLARLKEVSTWRGIIMVVSAVGVALSPAQTEAIIAAGMALVGAIEVFRKDTPVVK